MAFWRQLPPFWEGPTFTASRPSSICEPSANTCARPTRRSRTWARDRTKRTDRPCLLIQDARSAKNHANLATPSSSDRKLKRPPLPPPPLPPPPPPSSDFPPSFRNTNTKRIRFTTKNISVRLLSKKTTNKQNHQRRHLLLARHFRRISTQKRRKKNKHKYPVKLFKRRARVTPFSSVYLSAQFLFGWLRCAKKGKSEQSVGVLIPFSLVKQETRTRTMPPTEQSET